MSVYYNIMNAVMSSLKYLLVFSVTVDVALSYVIKRRDLLLKNEYYNLHVKHGFFKVTTLKIVAALIVGYLTIDPAPNIAGLIMGVYVYAAIVIKLLIDFIKSLKMKQ